MESEERDNLGFMEFFDWLAGTSDKELCHIADDLGVSSAAPMDNLAREALGLRVWNAM